MALVLALMLWRGRLLRAGERVHLAALEARRAADQEEIQALRESLAARERAEAAR
jgi:hypothetical protein